MDSDNKKIFKDHDDHITNTIAQAHMDLWQQHAWPCFVESLDIGLRVIDFTPKGLDGHWVYEITNPQKHLMAKLRYGF